MTRIRFALLTVFFATFVVSVAPLTASPGIKPVGKDGKPLNLDFEDGTLKDWKAEGNAFEKQPVKGDTVFPRRNDMKSQHQGNYWIGTFEIGGDDLTGTLTSVQFKVTQPWASFLVAGGNWPGTRVELIRTDTQKVIFKAAGTESENLRPIVVDLQQHVGKEIFIRIVDQQKGPWGHINFDDFEFYAERPKFDNELDPAKAIAEAPPADALKFAGLPPEDAAKAMTLPPGFKATLFAGEPDVQQPIAFAIDHRGRLWVAEGLTYPIRRGKPQDNHPDGVDRSKPTPEQLKDIFGGDDRILVFEDTNGDGKFDRRTVFAEHLNLVSGLEFGFGGVWVGAAPYLMFIPIQDGDAPKPAGDPQILLDGWNYNADTHETLNTFTWGPDGWLYGCHGVFCPSFVAKPGTPQKERQRMDAGVWRYHPTKHVFEVFAEGTSNPWGVDFDEYGQCFIEACVIPHLWHMVQGGRFERQGGQHFNVNREETLAHERFTDPNQRFVNPFIYDDIKTIGDHVHWAGNKGPHAANGRSAAVGGGHAHAGMMVYLGESWPEQYRGKFFMNNIHGACINMDAPERQGSGYVGHHAPNFIDFNDVWSQVLNLEYDQNGSVYMIDWYDKNQCHHNNPEGHDRSNGRIFKIVYNDQKTTKVDLQKLSDEELVKLVPSKNEWMSRHARRVLQERHAAFLKEGMPALGRLIDSKGGNDAELRKGEAESLRQHGKRVNDLLQSLAKTSSTTERLRLMWALHASPPLDEDWFNKMSDEDALVRAWAIQFELESGQLSPAVAEKFHTMAREEKSPVVRLYLASALQRIPVEQRWDIYTALLQRAEDANDHNIPLMVWYGGEMLVGADFKRALALAVDAKLPRILNFTTRRAAAIGTPEALAAITKTLNGMNDDARRLDMLAGLGAALKGRRSVPMPQGWEQVEARLGTSANPEIRALTQSLSLTFGSANALAALKKTLTDSSADLNARRTALDSLLGPHDATLPPLLLDLLQDRDLRGQAIRALASYDDPKTSDAILSVHDSLDAGEKRDALNTLSSRAAYAKPLLAAVAAGKVPHNALTAEIIRQLRNLKNGDLDQTLQKVYGTVRESSADKQKEIERYKQLYRAGGSQPGDAPRGRVVFTKVCAQCHTLFDEGGKVGPDLTGSNRSDLDYILQNILDPNAVIPNEYRASTVEMKDGRSITGIVKQQDDKSATVVTQNESLVLPRNEIQSVQQSELSMMPEGLLAPLQDQEVRDLIYYLGRPGQVPLPVGAK